jgi:ADP-L-glycero-D-manno-heptose 6-epimerase
MTKLRSIGYNQPFITLEEGVKDYVQNYLSEQKYF